MYVLRHGGKRERKTMFVCHKDVARPTLVSLATARGVNRVWIKILGQLMHIVRFATAVTTRLQPKFTHQRTASASGQQFARPTFATLEPRKGPAAEGSRCPSCLGHKFMFFKAVAEQHKMAGLTLKHV